MKRNIPSYSKLQLIALILLRVAIGWHFLYEGISKLLQPNWTAQAYLLDAKGLLQKFYASLANDKQLLDLVDITNKYGLILIGLSLMVGLLTRWSSLAGILLLLLYYLSHIPMVGVEYMLPTEGSYLWVDKNLIEMLALLVCFGFPTSHLIGLDRFFTVKSSISNED